jgi:hypothetical protein
MKKYGKQKCIDKKKAVGEKRQQYLLKTEQALIKENLTGKSGLF